MNLDDLIPEPEDPVIVHFFSPITIPWPGRSNRLVMWGDEVTITPTIRALSIDRIGHSWLDLLHDPEAQVRRWGKARFAPGPWPTDMPRLEPGSIEATEQVARAYQEAWSVVGENARAKALREVRLKYGNPPSGTQTIMTLGDQQS